jgi:hypothetical protein
MISLEGYTAHDRLGLADLVARKELTPNKLARRVRGCGESRRQNQCRTAGRPRRDSRRFAARPVHRCFRSLIKVLVLHAKGVR